MTTPFHDPDPNPFPDPDPNPAPTPDPFPRPDGPPVRIINLPPDTPSPGIPIDIPGDRGA
jgi:hypothetical protein